jgi:hypothetical protein
VQQSGLGQDRSVETMMHQQVVTGTIAPTDVAEVATIIRPVGRHHEEDTVTTTEVEDAVDEAEDQRVHQVVGMNTAKDIIVAVVEGISEADEKASVAVVVKVFVPVVGKASVGAVERVFEVEDVVAVIKGLAREIKLLLNCY